MKKLRFQAGQNMRAYHSIPDWLDNEEREVSNAEAERLLTDFPRNFFEVVAKVEPESVVDENWVPTETSGEKSEKLDKLSDKGIFPDKRKRGR